MDGLAISSNLDGGKRLLQACKVHYRSPAQDRNKGTARCAGWIVLCSSERGTYSALNRLRLPAAHDATFVY